MQLNPLGEKGLAICCPILCAADLPWWAETVKTDAIEVQQNGKNLYNRLKAASLGAEGVSDLLSDFVCNRRADDFRKPVQQINS